jgi:hypothetical protein
MLRPGDVTALKDLWATMPHFAGVRPRPPQLGYRGCRVAHSGGEFFAFGGVVTLTAERATEARADVGEVFERRVLASAPAGLIPMESIRR